MPLSSSCSRLRVSPWHHRLPPTGETWGYAYNDRGEVAAGAKAVSSAPGAAVKRGLQFGYGYDLIGNRVTSAEQTPGATDASGMETMNWTPNELNQITSRQHPASRWVLGHVNPAATLTVNGGGPLLREGEEFQIPVDQVTPGAADWHHLDITATRAGAGVSGHDLTVTRSGRLWFPASPEAPSYDDDGNMVSDGRWSYEWDAENHLKAVETLPSAASAGVPPQRLEFAYDAKGRRVRKVVKNLDAGTQQMIVTSDLRFLYDDWNLMAESDASSSLPAPQSRRLAASYAWGRDLSGTMQGAGGIGGLVFVSLSSNSSPSAPSATLAPCYDGNGNISAYVNPANGTLTSRHDYGPFGREIWTDLGGTSTSSAVPPFRFGTKYVDTETNLYYYGFRYYSAELGRWPSRDPIAERGGINLYGMVRNDPINLFDQLGLELLNAAVTSQTIQNLQQFINTGGPTSGTGWTDTDWPENVATYSNTEDAGPSECQIILNGQVMITKYVGPNARMGGPADGIGTTNTRDHEDKHAAVETKWWDQARTDLNEYDKRVYCDCKFAQVAAEYINNMNSYYKNMAKAEDVELDSTAYSRDVSSSVTMRAAAQVYKLSAQRKFNLYKYTYKCEGRWR